MNKCKENCIEWLCGQDTITVTLSSARHIGRLFKLMESHPEITVAAENLDGTFVFHVPLSYLKFNAPKNLTEEQRQELVQRMDKINAKVETPQV